MHIPIAQSVSSTSRRSAAHSRHTESAAAKSALCPLWPVRLCCNQQRSSAAYRATQQQSCWRQAHAFVPASGPGMKRGELLSARASKQKSPPVEETSEDSPLPFAALSVIYAVLGIAVYVAPHPAADFVFGPAAGLSHEVTFKLLGIFFELVALYNFFQQSAAAEGNLGETIHRRGNGSLSFFGAACLSIPFLSYLTNPIITPTAGAIFGSLSAAQWLAAGRGYAKYSPDGANPFAVLQSYAKDLTQLRNTDGLNSTLFSMFTATFIGIGLAFLFFPEPTKAGMFGAMPALGPEDQLLWQILGSTIATVVGPICYTQQEAAIQNNFSQRPKRLLMGGLALASGAYVFTLLPLLFTDKAGGLLFWAGFPWGTLTVVSTLIAVKPKENEGWYTPW
ncbi:hypothetical protein WJX84_006889 [Apatococcus fuscideae]|uniref:Uncharacterized protein n=1 Tax=Apatococcus fuscideae TaxID=2026836 RepID=A0AAW1T0V9_9CHLO